MINQIKRIEPFNNISLIGAIGANGELGRDNKLLWDIPEDMQWFKDKTKHKVVVMGREMFDSLGKKPLPSRTNIVLSRNRELEVPKGVIVSSSIVEILEEFKRVEEIMVIGGSGIYKEFLPLASRIYLTEIEKTYSADTYFPVVDWGEWYRIYYDKRTQGDLTYSFNIYNKKSLLER